MNNKELLLISAAPPLQSAGKTPVHLQPGLSSLMHLLKCALISPRSFGTRAERAKSLIDGKK